jgi:hypothetical protein
LGVIVLSVIVPSVILMRFVALMMERP